MLFQICLDGEAISAAWIPIGMAQKESPWQLVGHNETVTQGR